MTLNDLVLAVEKLILKYGREPADNEHTELEAEVERILRPLADLAERNEVKRQAGQRARIRGAILGIRIS